MVRYLRLAFAVAGPFQQLDSVAATGTHRTQQVLLLDGSLCMSAKTGSVIPLRPDPSAAAP